jgi:multidrug resistance efflux pump
VTEILVAEGQSVAAAAPLLRLEPEAASAQRRELQAWVSRLEADFARLERAARAPRPKPAAAPNTELQQAHEEFAAARAEATAAELEYQRLAALYAAGDVPAKRRDDARAQRDLAADKAETARQRLAVLQRRAAEENPPAAGDPSAPHAEPARARLEQARRSLAAYEGRLREIELRAPAGARVQAIRVRKGDFVTPKQPLLTLRVTP